METEVNARVRAAWSTFGRYRTIFEDKELPVALKKKIFNQCVLPTLTYGCETWAFTKKLLLKIRTCQRAMERTILGLKLKDKVAHIKIREKTKVTDAITYVLTMKWRWAGHIARVSDDRWTKKCSSWKPKGSRRPGRPRCGWETDIRKYGGPEWRDVAQDRRAWKMMTKGYIRQWINLA